MEESSYLYNMKAILIKPADKRTYSKILEYIKALHIPAKILADREAKDELFINSIEERMKSPQAVSKEEIKKFFSRNGI